MENPGRFKAAIDRKLRVEGVSPYDRESAEKALSGCVMATAMIKAMHIIYKEKCMDREEFKRIRQALGWSQEKLAEELDISCTMVSRMEQGLSDIIKRTELSMRYFAQGITFKVNKCGPVRSKLLTHAVHYTEKIEMVGEQNEVSVCLPEKGVLCIVTLPMAINVLTGGKSGYAATAYYRGSAEGWVHADIPREVSFPPYYWCALYL